MFAEFRRAAVIAALAALFSNACAAEPAEGRVRRPDSRAVPAPPVAEGPANEVVALSSGSFAPAVGRLGEAWAVTWPEPVQTARHGVGNLWKTRRVGRDGKMLGLATRLAAAPPSVQALRAIEHGSELSLFYAASSEPAGSELGVFSLGSDLQLRVPPREVASPRAVVPWLDAVARQDGALLFWGEREADHVRLFTRSFSLAGELGKVVMAHAGARAWQVVEHDRGALLAVITTDGRLEVRTFEASGQVRATFGQGPAAVVHSGLDVVATPDGYLLAYGRQRGLRSELVTQRLNRQGDFVAGPVRAVNPMGEQRVSRLIGGQVPWLVWSNSTQEPGVLRAAPLDPEGRCSEDSFRVPVLRSHPQPEWAATGGAIALSLWDCAGAPECAAPAHPEFVVIDPRRGVESVEHLVRVGEPVELIWGLSCHERDCLVLSAPRGEPVSVLAHAFQPGVAASNHVSSVDRRAPEAVALEALIETPRLAALEVAAGGQWAASLSDFDGEAPRAPAPDGRSAPQRAQLRVQRLSDDGTALADSEVISYRARSESGMSLSHSGERTLLVWSAFDGPHPQLFTTLINAEGKRIDQAVQTNKPGDLLQVASATLPDGWFVTWIDERRGRAQVYATKLSPRLKRLSADLALGLQSSEANGVSASVFDGEVWVLASGQDEPVSRITLTRLGAANLERRAEPSVLHESERVLSVPRWLASGGSRMALWLETDLQGSSLAWLAVSERGAVQGPVQKLPFGGFAEDFGVSCEPLPCRWWAVAEQNGEPRLLGGAFEEWPQFRHLVRLTAAELHGVRVANRAGELWFSDNLDAERWGIHRAHIEWGTPHEAPSDAGSAVRAGHGLVWQRR